MILNLRMKFELNVSHVALILFCVRRQTGVKINQVLAEMFRNKMPVCPLLTLTASSRPLASHRSGIVPGSRGARRHPGAGRIRLQRVKRLILAAAVGTPAAPVFLRMWNCFGLTCQQTESKRTSGNSSTPHVLPRRCGGRSSFCSRPRPSPHPPLASR